MISAAHALTAKPKLFPPTSTYALGAIPGKKTRKCLTQKPFYFRSPDFDTRLPADQPDTSAGIVTALRPINEKDHWSLPKVAASLLGVSPQTSVADMGKTIKGMRLCMTLPQLEQMVEAMVRDVATGMVTNKSYGRSSYGNISFVENVEGNVSAAFVQQMSGSKYWTAYLHELSSGPFWDIDFRLLVPNYDSSKLYSQT